MLDALSRGVIRRPRLALLVWAVVAIGSYLLASGLGGEGLFDRLESGEPRVPGSESQEGRDLLAGEEEETEQVTLLVQGVDVTDEEVVNHVTETLAPLRAEVDDLEGVASVFDPFIVPEGPADEQVAPLVADSQDGFLLIAEMEPGIEAASPEVTAVAEELTEIPPALSEEVGTASGIVSSSQLLTDAVIDQVQADLTTGEAVALPASLLVMVLVFGGVLAAGLPLLGALASIGVGMGLLYAFSYAMDLDSIIVNVVTVLGLGLSIDYGLLLVSRFREEHAAVEELESAGSRRRRRRERGSPRVNQAVHQTMRTAGRTVTFSAVTIAVVVAALMVLRPDILRAIGLAGALVVVIALATALSLVPALLVLVGERLQRPSVLRWVPGLRKVAGWLGDTAPSHGTFARLARFVHDRPWPVLLGTLALLGLLASPVAGMHLRNSTTELLPASSEQREFISVLGEDYPGSATPDITVVVDASPQQTGGAREDLAAIDGVAQVLEVGTEDEDYSVFGVNVSADDAGGPVATDVVKEIRETSLGHQTWVVGQAANQIDFVGAILNGLPLAGAVVIVAIFALLFAMSGSLLIPLKAIVVNAVGLTAALGVTVWVFQEGHLAGLLGVTPIGGLEAYVVAIVVAFGFGLAMDYEVFLLARIKESWDAGQPNDAAVEAGLQRSGRIITSAALVIILVFLGFVAGELMVIKQVGFALAVTVFIDATLVRMLLVPATMTVLGRWNWWAPAPLQRLQRRLAGEPQHDATA